MTQDNRGIQIKIVKLRLQETGSFHDLYVRPYEMDLDESAFERIGERIMDAGSGRLTESAFHGISSSILSPVMDVDTRRDLIQISGGMRERRARFSMEVDITTKFGQGDRYYFQGYTDHYGVGESGSVDDKMFFDINSFIRVRRGLRMTQRGNEESNRVIEMAQIINGRVVYEDIHPTNKMRPVDLFYDIHSRNLEDAYTHGITDARTSLNSVTDIMVTNRSNNIASRYLAEAIGTYRHHRENESFGTGADNAVLRTQQHLNSELRNMEDNPFLRSLARVQGVYKTAHFTVRDLLELDPDCGYDDIIKPTRLSNKARTELATPDNCSDWKSPTIEAKWAVQISNAISVFMMENYHVRFVCDFTNETLNGKIISKFMDATPVAEGIPVDVVETIIRSIEDFLYDLSCRGQDSFEVFIQANQYDQTLVEISINGQPRERFWVPSFADSLLSGSYSRDRDSLGRLSHDLQGIIETGFSELSGSARELENAMAATPHGIDEPVRTGGFGAL